MTPTDTLQWLDAVDTARLVADGELSAEEVLEAAIERIERLDPGIGAVAMPTFELARRRLAEGLPHGPLHGVPTLIKDIPTGLAGDPVAFGIGVLRDAGTTLQADTVLGRRMHEAGLISLGRSKTPELSQQLDTQPPGFGPTRNPWAPDRSVAGSTGGGAAAVAAGLVPVVHGSDGGGSIRVPSGWCGVVGLKPSRGRVVTGPEDVSTTGVEGPIARTVRDVAAALDVMAGTLPGQLYHCPPLERPLLEEVGRDPGRLRIGVQSTAHGVAIHPEAAFGLERTAKVLAELGHDVVEANPPSPGELRSDAGKITSAVDPAWIRRRILSVGEMLGRPLTEEDVDPWTWARAAWDTPITPEDVVAEMVEDQALASALAAWWEAQRLDVLLSPTAAEPPVPLADLDHFTHTADELIARITSFGCFRLIANRTGQPGISLPLHWTADDLPLGMQFVGPAFGEPVLIRLAAQLEEAVPWHDRHPTTTEM